jgi:AbrB family looped-hinge helix DNA binding protein
MPTKDTSVIEATLTSKGQITIPGEIRKELHLTTGDKVRFVRGVDGNISIEARKKKSIVDYARANPIRLRQPAGKLDAFIDQGVTEAITARLRRAAKNRRP